MSFRKKAEYAAKLLDPRWLLKRDEILKRDGFACRECGETKLTLNVHHERYFKNREPWDYDGEYLTTLCIICHDYRHSHFSEHDKPITKEFVEKELGFTKFHEMLSGKVPLSFYLGPESRKTGFNLMIFIADCEKHASRHINLVKTSEWNPNHTYEQMIPYVEFYENIYGQHRTKTYIRRLIKT